MKCYEHEAFSDSAGDTIAYRVGDFHCVVYWTGDDVVYIYRVKKDMELSQVIEFNEEMHPLFEHELK